MNNHQTFWVLKEALPPRLYVEEHDPSWGLEGATLNSMQTAMAGLRKRGVGDKNPVVNCHGPGNFGKAPVEDFSDSSSLLKTCGTNKKDIFEVLWGPFSSARSFPVISHFYNMGTSLQWLVFHTKPRGLPVETPMESSMQDPRSWHSQQFTRLRASCTVTPWWEHSILWFPFAEYQWRSKLGF